MATRADILVDLGSVFYVLNDIKKSEDFMLRALNIQRSIYDRDHIEIRKTLLNLAKIYQIQKNYIEMHNFFEESFVTGNVKFDDESLIMSKICEDIGMQYYYLNCFSNAQIALKRATQIKNGCEEIAQQLLSNESSPKFRI